MVNAYYDFPSVAGFTPYVGGGIGIARNELSTTTISSGGVQLVAINGSTRNEFAWQVGAGLALSVLPAVAIDIGYHYLDAAKFQTSSTGTVLGTPFSGSPGSGRLTDHDVTAA